jgi:hypothetical protein
MASHNSTVLPREVGVTYRRVYSTMLASVATLAELEEQMAKRPRNKKLVRTLIDSLEIFMSNLDGQLNELGVPKDWRDSKP